MASVVNLKSEGTSSPLYGIATKKVLVIDDQKSARLIMEGVVRCIDPYIKANTFASPLEAIEWARQNVPDLILTDYKMREIDGCNLDHLWDMLSFVREDAFWRKNAISIPSLRTRSNNGLLKHENITNKMGGNGPALAARLRRYTEGTFAGIFSEQSNVDLNSNFIVFNIRDLEEDLRPIGMYITLNYIWNRVKTEKKKRILVIDEAWQLMQYEDSAKFMFAIAKRARKYYLGLTTISQDVEDFLNTTKGRAIVNNSSLQLLLKQNPAAVDLIAQVFKLTQEETKRLTQFPVGEGLFFAGLSHVVMRIMGSPTEEQLITTNPKELLERQMQT